MDNGRIDDDAFAGAFAVQGGFKTLRVQERAEEFVGRIRSDPGSMARRIALLAHQGSVPAQIAWGHMLMDGRGTHPDPSAGLQWFLHAAQSGDAEAENLVGRCFELGIGTRANATKGAFWYRQAAERGNPWGQFNLAVLLAQGHGVPMNVPAATTLLVRSARQGLAKAMNMLGRLREDEATGRVKPKSAAFWYERAARAGCFRGQFHYARVLAVTHHEQDAALWLKTSLNGAPADFRSEAIAYLQNSTSRELRALAGGLPKAGLGEAP